MTAKLSDQETVPVMLKAGLKPLEPYPGANNKPWRCQHQCGRIVSPCYNSVQRGGRGCVDCGNEAMARAKMLDERAAKAVMKKADLTPLEPYPGKATEPWRCRHKCGRIVSPRYADIQQGQGGCVDCGVEKRARTQMLDAKAAKAVMKKAGLTPLEPYPGSKEPWRCRHERCGQEVSPRYHDIQQGGGGCEPCGFKAMAQTQMLDAKAANVVMKKAGLTPLEPYHGKDKPWRCRHERCGQEVSPSYGNIRQRAGGCRFCAEYGINFSKPGWLYFMYHAKFNLLQIGITNNAQRRLNEHRRAGWTLIEVMGPWKMARDTETWEKALLAALKRRGAVFAKDAEIQFKDLTITEAWTRDSFDATSLKELLMIVSVKSARCWTRPTSWASP